MSPDTVEPGRPRRSIARACGGGRRQGPIPRSVPRGICSSKHWPVCSTARFSCTTTVIALTKWRRSAGNAISYGLDREAALRAVTLEPARIWGVADRVGSLDVGKDADVVVWSGDPFELTAGAEHVFIAGRE